MIKSLARDAMFNQELPTKVLEVESLEFEAAMSPLPATMALAETGQCLERGVQVSAGVA